MRSTLAEHSLEARAGLAILLLVLARGSKRKWV
jgi:hypothetical protein